MAKGNKEDVIIYIPELNKILQDRYPDISDSVLKYVSTELPNIIIKLHHDSSPQERVKVLNDIDLPLVREAAEIFLNLMINRGSATESLKVNIISIVDETSPASHPHPENKDSDDIEMAGTTSKHSEHS